MYSIDYTNRFKKSLRKSVKRGLDVTLIEEAIDKLSNEGKLPPSYLHFVAYLIENQRFAVKEKRRAYEKTTFIPFD